jgi:release factor glutamine methyltransferase
MPKVKKVLDRAERRLIASEAVDHPHKGKELADAEEILAFVLGSDDDELDPERRLRPKELRRFGKLIARREAGEPPAYITGTATFFGLRLEVGPGAFIPRESSEWLAEQAIRRLRRRSEAVHVDLATGVGPVALAVASRLPQARVIGTDISKRPIRMARENARGLALGNVEFLRGDLFGPVPAELRGSVDVVTVHPPYVGKRDLHELPEEIVGFEPREAITDESPLGDRILERVAQESPEWLHRGGWVLVEVSPDRSRGVASVLRRAGFKDVRSTAGGIKVSRVVVGRT